MDVEFLRIGPGSEWDQVVTSLPHDFYHLSRYNEIEAKRSDADATLFVLKVGDFIGAIPLLIRRICKVPGLESCGDFDATSAYGYPGPIASSQETSRLEIFWNSVKKDLVSSGVVSVFSRFHPLLNRAEAWHQAFPTIASGATVGIDLSATDLLGSVSSNHRRDLKRLLKENFVVEHDETLSCLDFFMSAYHETMTRNVAGEVSFFTQDYFENICSIPGAELWIVKHEQKPVSGAIFFRVGEVLQYHLGATPDEFLNLSSNKLLFYRIATIGSESGMKWLHLGGGLGGGENDGLFRFKMGFGGTRLPFHVLKHVVNDGRYETLVEQRSRVGGAAKAGFFPAYRG